MYMLIGLYVLTPIFRRLVTHCGREHLEYLLILFLLGSCLTIYNTVNADHDIPLLPDNVNLLIFTLSGHSGYIGFYFAGYYFANFTVKKRTEYAIYALGALSFVVAVAGTSVFSLYKGHVVKAFSGQLSPTSILQAFAIFLLFKRLFGNRAFSERARGIIGTVGKNTLGIYLFHGIFLSKITLTGFDWRAHGFLVAGPVIGIAAIVVSYGFTVVLRRIPGFRKIL
jgi:surface polysaccharide O-acyltransferase-like enzyme